MIIFLFVFKCCHNMYTMLDIGPKTFIWRLESLLNLIFQSLTKHFFWPFRQPSKIQCRAYKIRIFFDKSIDVLALTLETMSIKKITIQISNILINIHLIFLPIHPKLLIINRTNLHTINIQLHKKKVTSSYMPTVLKPKLFIETNISFYLKLRFL